MVEELRHSGMVLPTLDATFLMLIQKEEHMQDPMKFRPIALCNPIYKMVIKIIANRIKLRLPEVISKE